MQTIECSPKYAEKRFDMNHPIDPNPQAHPRVDPELCRRVDLYPESNRRADPETNPKGCRSGCDHAEGGAATRQSGCPNEDSKRLKLLDTLIDKIIQRMNDNSWDDQLLLW